jgi:hypothetical protein
MPNENQAWPISSKIEIINYGDTRPSKLKITALKQPRVIEFWVPRSDISVLMSYINVLARRHPR